MEPQCVAAMNVLKSRDRRRDQVGQQDRRGFWRKGAGLKKKSITVETTSATATAAANKSNADGRFFSRQVAAAAADDAAA